MGNINIFENIISDEEHFFDLPDCIGSANDYKETLEKSFELTKGILALEEFKSFDKGNIFELNIAVNGLISKIELEKISDFVDSINFIKGINQILIQHNYKGLNKFCDINGGVADFGIAFITKEKELELAKKGLIWRDESFYIHKGKKVNKSEYKRDENNKRKSWWKFW